MSDVVNVIGRPKRYLFGAILSSENADLSELLSDRYAYEELCALPRENPCLRQLSDEVSRQPHTIALKVI